MLESVMMTKAGTILLLNFLFGLGILLLATASFSALVMTIVREWKEIWKE